MNDDKRAFPCNIVQCDYGMSLRDYFAGQALHGLCANQSYVAAIATDDSLDDVDKPNKLAEICYELADAMLLERDKNNEK